MVVFAIIVAGVISMPRIHSMETTYVAYIDHDSLSAISVVPHVITYSKKYVKLQSLYTPDSIAYQVDSVVNGNYYIQDVIVVPGRDCVIFYRRDDPSSSRIFSKSPVFKAGD